MLQSRGAVIRRSRIARERGTAGWRRSLPSATRLVVIGLRNSGDGIIHPWDVNGRDNPCNLRVGTHPVRACFRLASFPHPPVGGASPFSPTASASQNKTTPHAGLSPLGQGHVAVVRRRVRQAERSLHQPRSFRLEVRRYRVLHVTNAAQEIHGDRNIAGHASSIVTSQGVGKHPMRQLVLSSTLWTDQNRSGEARKQTV